MKFEIGQIVYSIYASNLSVNFDPSIDLFGPCSSEKIFITECDALRIVATFGSGWVKVATEAQDLVWLTEASLCTESDRLVSNFTDALKNLNVSDYWLAGNSITFTGHNNFGDLANNYVYVPNVTTATDYITVGEVPSDVGFIRMADDINKNESK